MLYGTAGALAPMPFFIWIIQRNFIRAEERFMEAAFGAEYLAYKQRVRRWL
jgi:protein-S-isoprenylcysteine O-methyltransferase Ste14